MNITHFKEPLVANSNYALAIILFSGILGICHSLYQYYIVRKTKLYYNHDYLTVNSALLSDEHDQMRKIREISSKISKGASAFLAAEFKCMTLFMIVFAGMIYGLVGSAGNCGELELVDGHLISKSGSCKKDGLLTSISFVVGCITSMISGYIGMKIAVYSNSRTTVGAMKSWNNAFNTAFRGGAVMGFSLCSLALLVLYATIEIFHTCIGSYKDVTLLTSGHGRTLFECIAGFGLGGSSIAMFGRVGGGIFTKAADVGADLVGKVEIGLAEDDPRNPAVIADNVGDNVGDVAGMGSDLFGSFAEASCAALVVSSYSPDLSKYWGSLMFPLLVSAIGIITCFITSFFATTFNKVRKEEHIERTLKYQLIISTLLTTPAIFMLAYLFLPEKFCVMLSNNLTDTNFQWLDSNPQWCSLVTTNMKVFACTVSGLWTGLIIGYFTEYMTSHSYKPVREIAQVSAKYGAAANIIYGLSLGYYSTVIPVIAVASTMYMSFTFANMYGIVLAAIGMLSTLAIGLTIDCYGPISDNAGGIAEMAGLDEDVRIKTDALDAAGNTTAAIGKGFSIGSAALVSLALFGAFVTRCNLTTVDILKPITFSMLLFGAMVPYLFTAMTMKSVGKAANKMIEEVRRQFRENPDIMLGTCEPDSEKCVTIATNASLKEMILPSMLVIKTPIMIGFFFGVHAVSGYLAGTLVSSIQLAISSSNTGGAWDNAKKYIEKGAVAIEEEDESGQIVHIVQGKGSPAHIAAVIGDTVGDPLKDTSGPALNIVMKLSAIISLVFADFFLKHSLM